MLYLRNLFLGIIMTTLPISPIYTKPRVVVVGAGLAGLTAAYRLLQAGHDINLYEARAERVGGRVFSVRIGDAIGELGGFNINDGGSAPLLRALAHELNLNITNITWPSQHGITMPYFENGVMTYYENGFTKYKHTPEKLHAQLKELAESSHTMHDILEQLFPHDPELKRICSIRLAAHEGAPVEVLSSQCFETLYQMILGGVASSHPANAPLIYSVIEGGNSKLPQALAEQLGNRLHRGKILRKVTKSATAYLLEFADGTTVHADVVLLAIPSPVYKDIQFDETVLPTTQHTMISRLPLGISGKILIPVEKPQHYQISCTNGRAILFRGQINSIATLYYINASDQFSPENIEDFFAQDKQLIDAMYTIDHRTPEHVRVADDCMNSSACGPVGHCWLLDPYAQGSYSCLAAGFEEVFTATEFYEGERVKTLFAPRDHSLFFLGEHTTVGYDIMGTMEAAIESAERTIRMVSTRLGL